jgi:hypothetical protein
MRAIQARWVRGRDGAALVGRGCDGFFLIDRRAVREGPSLGHAKPPGGCDGSRRARGCPFGETAVTGLPYRSIGPCSTPTPMRPPTPRPRRAARGRPVGGLFRPPLPSTGRRHGGRWRPSLGKVRPIAGGCPDAPRPRRRARPLVDASAAYGEAARRRPVAGVVVGGRTNPWRVRHAGRRPAAGGLPCAMVGPRPMWSPRLTCSPMLTRSADQCPHSALVVKI